MRRKPASRKLGPAKQVELLWKMTSDLRTVASMLNGAAVRVEVSGSPALGSKNYRDVRRTLAAVLRNLGPWAR